MHELLGQAPPLSPPTKPPGILPLRWPGKLNLHPIIPHKIRAPARRLRLRLRNSQGPHGKQQHQPGDITRLQTSFDIRASLRALRTRRWSLWDLQHLATFAYILFSLAILPSAPLVKTGGLVVLGVLLLMPVTRQFFLPSLPIWTYLLYFFSSR